MASNRFIAASYYSEIRKSYFNESVFFFVLQEYIVKHDPAATLGY
ncbi:hypothetical protein CPter291_4896 [Collimonas pratensis]|uniref:Uncharacterized protein n=1 Tax=Collimonas pratensis TaxID=279113 RepID=A0ABN4MKG9_9BURK|nr:hypothetical protein CPter291_4896 [Collimonas pratensis]